MSAPLDAALRALRAFLAVQGYGACAVHVRADGRVVITFDDVRGSLTRAVVVADLDPDSAHKSPDLAMHAAFAEWGAS